jgi:hypothetical protein
LTYKAVLEGAEEPPVVGRVARESTGAAAAAAVHRTA